MSLQWLFLQILFFILLPSTSLWYLFFCSFFVCCFYSSPVFAVFLLLSFFFPVFYTFFSDFFFFFSVSQLYPKFVFFFFAFCRLMYQHWCTADISGQRCTFGWWMIFRWHGHGSRNQTYRVPCIPLPRTGTQILFRQIAFHHHVQSARLSIRCSFFPPFSLNLSVHGPPFSFFLFCFFFFLLSTCGVGSEGREKTGSTKDFFFFVIKTKKMCKLCVDTFFSTVEIIKEEFFYREFWGMEDGERAEETGWRSMPFQQNKKLSDWFPLSISVPLSFYL